MTKEEYLDFCGSIAGATYDQPFNEDFQSTALRHWDTKKWFGLLMFHNDRWIVNLKLKPEEVLFYRDIYEGVTEAYHMNKVHWITLYLDSDVPTEEIEDLTLRSFELTKRKDKKKPKSERKLYKMRTFSKSSKLDNVCYDIRGPVMDEANEMIAKGEKIFKLNIGNPAPFAFNAPDEIIQAMTDNLRNAQGYSDSKGITEARQAIYDYAHFKGIPVESLNDIYTGNGVSELITMVMQGLLNNGDEVLVPAPDYPLWTASVTLAGGTAVHYICDESSEWYPDLEDMEKKITDKTKAIVIINPNNPTGAVYPKEILEKIADMARRHELIIFSDEIYDRLLMDGVEHTSIASLCLTFSASLLTDFQSHIVSQASV